MTWPDLQRQRDPTISEAESKDTVIQGALLAHHFLTEIQGSHRIQTAPRKGSYPTSELLSSGDLVCAPEKREGSCTQYPLTWPSLAPPLPLPSLYPRSLSDKGHPLSTSSCPFRVRTAAFEIERGLLHRTILTVSNARACCCRASFGVGWC